MICCQRYRSINKREEDEIEKKREKEREMKKGAEEEKMQNYVSKECVR